MSGLIWSDVVLVSLRISLFVALLLPTSFMVVRAVVPNYLSNWNVGKEVLWSVGHLALISLNNILLVQHMELLANIGVVYIVWSTFCVGAIPVGADLLVRWQRSKPNKSPVQSLIVYVKSDGNYVNVYTQTPDGVDREFHRSTLKHFNQKHPELVQVHKRYLVNEQSIVALNGNSNGGRVKLQSDVEVPYSRSYFSTVKSMNVKAV